jgi:hypothetical protein
MIAFIQNEKWPSFYWPFRGTDHFVVARLFAFR